MFCPKCGKETDASGQFCQWCGAPIDAVPAGPTVMASPEVEEEPEIGVYAGLGRRFVAFIIDIILIALFGVIVVAFFNQANGIMYLYYLVALHAPISSLTDAGTPIAALGPIVAAVGLLVVVVPWLYYAGFESSRGQATPGKVLMRLEVTDLEGNRISFARATLRFFGKFISTLIIFIGFLMIGLTKKRQGLHDKIAGCLVLLQE
ncbi:RDD family protein [Methanoregula sp.]|uniref:RDD family protein n=1 Tax=Methanoregula sp. TaxID=2052170 RepID=UPI002CDCCFC1|nr:RDD family protein [Methanoregula sp.]HVP96305.1 RDD family protein [Methanoregula sp.]